MGYLTIRGSMASTMLLASHLDYHLPEARHDSGRAEVAKIRHTIAGAQRQGGIGVRIFGLGLICLSFSVADAIVF